MRYILVHGTTGSELSFKVEEKVEEGWKPQGGVSVNTEVGLYKEVTVFWQAMVKD